MIRALALLLLMPLTSFAGDKQYGSVIVSEVTSIYDADTFRVNIKGYPPIASERIYTQSRHKSSRKNECCKV